MKPPPVLFFRGRSNLPFCAAATAGQTTTTTVVTAVVAGVVASVVTAVLGVVTLVAAFSATLGSGNLCLGLVSPGQLDVLLQLLAGEVARRLGQQLDRLDSGTRLGTLSQRTHAGRSHLVILSVVQGLQGVGLYGSLEDGQVVNLDGVAHQDLFAHALDEVDEDTRDAALREHRVVLRHVACHVLDAERLFVTHAGVQLARLFGFRTLGHLGKIQFYHTVCYVFCGIRNSLDQLHRVALPAFIILF